MTMLNNSSISLVLRSKLWILNLLEHPNHTSTSMRLIPRAPPFGDEDGCAPIRRSKWRLCKMHDIFQSEGIFVPRLLKESDMKSWNTMKYHRIKELQQQVMSGIKQKMLLLWHHPPKHFRAILLPRSYHCWGETI